MVPSPAAAASHSLDDLFSYLAMSPSPYHAVAASKARLDAAGYSELAETDSWDAETVSGRRYVIRGGALLAWDGTHRTATTGFHIVGAHTDSPNLRLKPKPDTGNVGYRQLGVEVYGGILSNSWLDRDLGISGRITMRNGEFHLLDISRPLARITQLAIHLDRDVNEKGLALDKQLHLSPIVGLGASSEGDVQAFLARSVGVKAKDIAGWDLMLRDLTPPALLGLQEEFIVSARIDNQFSCWAATAALASLVDAPTKGRGKARTHSPTPVIALFDHEEVGSSSTTGAAGPLLERVLDRIVHAGGGSVDERARSYAASSCISADMAHAVHPNYADRHEPAHRPMPNAGPVIKVNANQRYATDSSTAAFFADACRRAGVPFQTFVSRNSQPCGSTIGPITATRLGIDTVDVGCAMLSMHSAREMCGSADAAHIVNAMKAYLQPGT